MNNIKDISLSGALSAVGLKELPKAYRTGDKGFWINAVTLVRKRDMSESYALAKKGADGTVRYTKDFGHVSPIMALLAIHPYKFIDENRYMNYEDDKMLTRDLIGYFGEEKREEIESADENKRLQMTREMAISYQERDEKYGFFNTETSEELEPESENDENPSDIQQEVANGAMGIKDQEEVTPEQKKNIMTGLDGEETVFHIIQDEKTEEEPTDTLDDEQKSLFDVEEPQTDIQKRHRGRPRKK